MQRTKREEEYDRLQFETHILFRISVIFRVRSAKAVKITDMDLIKRLGIIVGIFVLLLLIRTLVSPPKGSIIYILASDFFDKDDKYVFKARNSCCV